jgi:hypothetical protein
MNFDINGYDDSEFRSWGVPLRTEPVVVIAYFVCAVPPGAPG